jgi:altronate dehydratase
MMGYIAHPMVRHCMLLEHGCEKTHNDYMRQRMKEMGIDPNDLGYASIQLDGGIANVMQKVEAWFMEQTATAPPVLKETVGLEALRVGLMNDGFVPIEAAEQFAILTKMIVGAGGLVVVPENSGILSSRPFMELLPSEEDAVPTLAYGEHAQRFGFHIMEMPTQHWVETMTGLAAAGVEILIALVNERPMQTHPFVPVLQVATEPHMRRTYGADLDLILTGHPDMWVNQLLERCKRVFEHQDLPRLCSRGNVDFQITRGYLGVSL